MTHADAWLFLVTLGRLTPYTATGGRYAVRVTLSNGQAETGYSLESFHDAALDLASRLKGLP